jgi:aryl-alcohol dehydrogenase-like predicted oxidoreductase
MKLALGTVQFGMAYGIANQSGQINRLEAGHILSLARDTGIDTLDTAISYGDSEACLGSIGTQGLKVVTKLPALPTGIHDIGVWVHEQMLDSLHRLKVDSVYALLLHRSHQLLGDAGRSVKMALDRLKAEGVVNKIGVSIYAPQELDAVTQACAIDLVQAPCNLVDRRLVSSGWLQRLSEAGVEVHARSAFLQGLLLLPRTAIPTRFECWASLWDAWHDGLARHGLTATAACLHYPLSLPQIDRVVVGVDSAAQLGELIGIARSPAPPLDWTFMVSEDESLINPARWNTQ